MIKIKIPFCLPSLNDYVDACRSNVFEGSRHKKKVERDIMWCLPKVTVDTPVFVKFIWHEPTKRRDKDNVAFAKKYILDALQKKKILPNDNNKWIIGFSDEFVYGSTGVEVLLIQKEEGNV